MKVSVVIPAYNEEKYLANCLQSLREQTELPDEIIVVDNNSQDNTANIAKRFGVKVMKEKQQGIVFARNTGFNAVTSDIIARCDSDSILPNNWISEIKRNFKNDNVVAVTGPCYFYDIRFMKKLSRIPQEMHTHIYFRTHRHLIGYNTLFGSNMALRASAWHKVRNEVCEDGTKLHEDMDLAGHLAAHGMITYDPKLLASASSRRARRLQHWINYAIRWIRSLLHMKQISD